MAKIINNGKFVGRDDNGDKLAGGKLYTYVAGSAGATPKATYTTSALNTANANPVILDANGRADVWTAGGSYLLVLKDASDNTIWTVDDYNDGLESDVLGAYDIYGKVTASEGQTTFSVVTITSSEYALGVNALRVFVNGVLQTSAYAETTGGDDIEFREGLNAGDLVEVYVRSTISSGISSADLVGYNPPIAGDTPTNVRDALRALDVKLMANLYAIDGTYATKVLLNGYYEEGDGGGGEFYWDGASVEADNGGTIIKPTATTTGRWKRIYSGAVNVKWFGFREGNTASANSAIFSTILSAFDKNITIFLPEGDYPFDYIETNRPFTLIGELIEKNHTGIINNTANRGSRLRCESATKYAFTLFSGTDTATFENGSFTFRDITLTGRNIANTANVGLGGIKLGTITGLSTLFLGGFELNNVYCSHFTENGVWQIGAGVGLVEKCSFEYNGQDGYHFSTDLQTNTSTAFIKCSFRVNGRYGVQVTGLTNGSWVDCIVESNVYRGFNVTSGAGNDLVQDCSFVNTYIEANNSTDIDFIDGLYLEGTGWSVQGLSSRVISNPTNILYQFATNQSTYSYSLPAGTTGQYPVVVGGFQNYVQFNGTLAQFNAIDNSGANKEQNYIQSVFAVTETDGTTSFNAGGLVSKSNILFERNTGYNQVLHFGFDIENLTGTITNQRPSTNPYGVILPFDCYILGATIWHIAASGTPTLPATARFFHITTGFNGTDLVADSNGTNAYYTESGTSGYYRSATFNPNFFQNRFTLAKNDILNVLATSGDWGAVGTFSAHIEIFVASKTQ